MVEFSYKYESSRMVVLRCIGPSNFFLERVLFPTDILTFMAPDDSRVEIWGNELYGPKLEERIRVSSDNKDVKLVAWFFYYWIVFESEFLTTVVNIIDIIEEEFLFMIMTHLASFAIGGFVPSAAIAGVLVLIGLGAFFYLGIKGPTDY